MTAIASIIIMTYLITLSVMSDTKIKNTTDIQIESLDDLQPRVEEHKLWFFPEHTTERIDITHTGGKISENIKRINIHWGDELKVVREESRYPLVEEQVHIYLDENDEQSMVFIRELPFAIEVNW
ncbi:hypothetical protein HXA32_20200 [Salipaludibacillus agaradhaerens]|uniref:hypothetical protein n=1 Tax=Salipaludibacillus agaradhaerens TaxID=76935 RepID=UPI0021517718|nr:hypothetical protein [Salipaludibacillus agaradhaerens]MCR6108595.1 hypothetical protein [Salipaludibacillus agaradhaerens]